MSTDNTTEASNLLGALGLAPASATLANVAPFRLSTVQEVVLSRAALSSTSGLSWESFAENPWGFPFVPYTSDRNPSDDGRLVLAPESVSYQWLGHPIFWIDPELTEPTEAERADPARWCVRMFYVIMSLGLWDVRAETSTPLAWYDAPGTAKVGYDQEDYRAYLQNKSSALDAVRYEARDMMVSPEEVTRQAERALEATTTISERAWRKMRAEQHLVAQRCERLLSSDADAPFSKASQRVKDLCVELAGRVSSGKEVGDLVSPVYDAVNDVVDLFNVMERDCLVIAVPTMSSLSEEPAALARLASSLELYEGRVVDGLYTDELHSLVDDLFRAAALDARDFALLSERVEQLHLDLWRRLKVAVVNAERASQGVEPYPSYLDYELHTSLSEDQG